MNSPSTLLQIEKGSPLPRPKSSKRPLKRNWTRFLWLFILTPLLYFALRNAPLNEIWNALDQLRAWQIGVLVLINVSIYLLVSLRWWIVIRAGRKTIAFLPLVLVRVAVFGVSYFTLGPQVGGEPLQILYLQRKYGMTYTSATSTVIMDKLLELLANFFLLIVGMMAVLQAGILSTTGGQTLVSLIPLVGLLAWPLIHILLMMKGIYPIGTGLRAVFSRFGN